MTLKDMVESTVIASRVGVNDLEVHLRQKRLRWFGHIVRRDEEVEKKKVFELKIEERKKRGRPVKRWIDVVEEDMRKRGTGCRGYGGLEEESSERTGLTPLAGKMRQDNKWMMIMMAIVSKSGKPDLFITVNCHPNWSEIKSNLSPGQ